MTFKYNLLAKFEFEIVSVYTYLFVCMKLKKYIELGFQRCGSRNKEIQLAICVLTYESLKRF